MQVLTEDKSTTNRFIFLSKFLNKFAIRISVAKYFLKLCVGIPSSNITKWWNTNVAPWFTVAKWKTLGENLKNGVFNGFKGIVQKTIDVLNSIIAPFEGMVNKVVEKVNDLIEKINDALGEFVPNIPNIKFKADFGRMPVPQFAEGGFPTSGEMFLARANTRGTKAMGLRLRTT